MQQAQQQTAGGSSEQTAPAGDAPTEQPTESPDDVVEGEIVDEGDAS
jgi:hypothetical protein